MNAITRATGITATEHYLAELADRTFLNLWSYPNVYKEPGKELCDLLVVCGEHILIFSDKRIAWPTGVDVRLGWQRWYRRAVQHSVNQIRGAERWIQRFPDRLFLDAQCRKPLPLALPHSNGPRVHGIAVLSGAGPACKSYFGGGRGSFMLFPNIKGDQHMGENADPFVIGDVAPGGSFVHVLDESVIDIVMSEMDTITDFTRYLSKKEALLRSGHLGAATGEEELVAWYATHVNTSGEHDFTRPDGSPLRNGEVLAFDEGLYDDLLSNPQYLGKKAADEISYVWDRLITTFTDHLLAGTNIRIDGMGSTLTEIERGVRHMVLEPRLHRRFMGQKIHEAVVRGAPNGRRIESFIPPPNAPDSGTAFFFMAISVPNFDLPEGYQDYRRLRLAYLRLHGMALLRKFPHLERVVGIASEPLAQSGAPQDSSEDLVLIEQLDWTPELVRKFEEEQAALDVMQEGRYQESFIHGTEYPDLEGPARALIQSSGPNRSQRRAMKATSKKTRPSASRSRRG